MVLNPVDIIALVIVLILGLRAAIRGFAREFLSVSGVLSGLLLGFLFSSLLSTVFARWLGEGVWNQILAFAAIFLGTWLIFFLFRNAMETVIDGFELESWDRVLGALMGVLEALVLIFILVFLASLLPGKELQAGLRSSVVWQVCAPFISHAHQAVETVIAPPVQALGSPGAPGDQGPGHV